MPVTRFHHFRVVLPSADEFLLPNALRVMNAQQRADEKANSVPVPTPAKMIMHQ